MFKLAIVLFAVVACVAGKPGIVAPLGYSAPLIAAPGIVTATSNQVIARNYNGIAAVPLLAAAPIAAPLAAAPFGFAPAAYSAPLRYAAAYNYAAAPLAARYVSPLAYSSPFSYAAPAQYLI